MNRLCHIQRIFAGAVIAVAILLSGARSGTWAADPAASAPAPAPAPPRSRHSDGRLLVLNKGDDTLMVFDIPVNTLLATVKVGSEPHEVTVTPDGRKAYVSNVGGKSVSVVDLRTYKVIATVKPDHVDYPHGLAATPDGRHILLTSEGSHRLYLINTTRDDVEKAVSTTQAGSHMIALARAGKRAWIANRGSESVSLYELPAFRLLKTVKVGQGPEGIAVSPNGRWLVVGLQNAGQAAVLDASSGQLLTRLPAGQTPIRVVFHPTMPVALVTNRDSGDVTALDIASRSAVATVQVGQRPGGVAFNARGTRAYVSNTGSNNLSIVSVPGYEVIGTIPAGKSPDGIAFVAEPAPPTIKPAKPAKPAKPVKSSGGKSSGT